jgi:hypothetical protein
MSTAQRKEYWKTWKANKRINDPSFVESERHHKAEWAKRNYAYLQVCKRFAKAYPELFFKFTQSSAVK